MEGYFLESKGSLKGLIKSIDSDISCTLTYTYFNALRFNTKKEASQYLIDHKFNKKARIIQI